MPRKPLLPLALAAAAGGVLAPSAAAATETTWNMTLEARGTYTGTFELTDDMGSTSSSEDAQWELRTEVAGVTVRDGRIVAVGGGHTTVAAAGGLDAVNTTVHGTTTVKCRGKALNDGFYGEPSVETGDAGDATGEVAEVFALRPFDELHVVVPCSAGGSPEEAIVPKRDAGWPMGNGPWDAIVAMPRLAYRQGTIIELLQPTTFQVEGACGDWLTTCDFTWSGTLTMTQTKYLGDDDLLAPLLRPPPPPAPNVTPGPGGSPPPAGKPRSTAAPKASSAKLGRGAAKASVKVTCGGACGGTITATALGARAAAASGGKKKSGKKKSKRPKALATARFSLPAAGSRTVSVRFGAKARRAIRKARGVRLTVKLTPRGGGKPVTRRLVAR